MNIRTKLSFFGVVALAVVGWSCGAQVIGEAMRDAGALLADSGVAHAQANCTWTVRRFSTYNSSGSLFEVPIERGWEPFAAAESAIFARRCQ